MERQNAGLDFVSVLRDCLNCAVISLNEDRDVIAFNGKAEQLTGLRADHMLDQGLELLPAPLRSLIEEVFSTGHAVAERRLLLRDKKRGEIAVQTSVTPTASSHAGGAGVVVVLNDLSAVRKWESNIRRLDRLHSVGTLSASMAHEVKNAFVAVRTFVDLLLEKNQQADLAEIVRQEMNRIDSIIGQMLKFSGPARPALSAIHLEFVLNKSLLLIQHLLEEKKIKLTRSFNASPDWIEGDPDQLEQAFLNLFFNALDAVDDQGRLEVATEILPPGAAVEGLNSAGGRQFVRLVVRDNGAGISPENMEHLFEPFFTTKPDGTGLGLAITQGIIQEHHGVISVHSQLNQGTEFSIILPAGKRGA
jgi:signal transduction histidine kinase